MTVEREFLGWVSACLPEVASRLIEGFGDDDGLDLGAVTVVTPGGRAQRRLVELLAERVRGVFVPPEFAQPGTLPELLYEPALPAATPVQALFARRASLRAAPRDLLARAFPQLPDDADLISWVRMAEELGRLDDSVTGDGLRIRDVGGLLSKNAPAFLESGAAFPEGDRWKALAAIHQLYLKLLDADGLCDRNEARLAALSKTSCRLPGTVVLAGAADLSPLAEQMLAQAADATPEAHVTVYIHAPKDHEDGFSPFGVLLTDYWLDQCPDFAKASAGLPDEALAKLGGPDEKLQIVDRPRDQAYAAVRSVVALGGERAVDEITVGVGDEELQPEILRRFAAESIPCRPAELSKVTQTGAALFLDAAARFAGSRRVEDLAALIRHPEFERVLKEKTGTKSGPSLCKTLDRTMGKTLERGVPSKAVLSSNPELASIYRSALDLMPKNAAKEKPLSTWAEKIADLLAAVYSDVDFSREHGPDRVTIEAFDQLGRTLRSLEELDDARGANVAISFPGAVRLLLDVCRNEGIPPEGGVPAVELVGWLELALDDAPVLVITGFNEGNIPQRAARDGYLPDSARKAIGLTSQNRRLARDLYLLCSIAASKEQLTIISGRRTAEDDPLLPSRLLLRGDDERRIAYIKGFYEESREPSIATPYLIRPVSRNELLMPYPAPTEKLTELSVTRFRSYLKCPYRFYLENVAKVRAVEYEPEELAPGPFGDIAHKVLGYFYHEGPRDSADSREIGEYLSETLDRIMAEAYSDTLAPDFAKASSGKPTIDLQKDLLRERLLSFAELQAKQRDEGWIIHHAEPLRGDEDHNKGILRMPFHVEEGEFTLKGHIDRIDYHEKNGIYRILDYKTSTDAKKPETVHRATDKTWRDLQLPLYRELALANGLVGDFKDDPEKAPLLGYINLPAAQAASIGIAEKWDEEFHAEAVDEARRIVGAILREEYWPPAPPPKSQLFEDPLVSICMDKYPERDRVIAQVSAAHAGGGE